MASMASSMRVTAAVFGNRSEYVTEFPADTDLEITDVAPGILDELYQQKESQDKNKTLLVLAHTINAILGKGLTVDRFEPNGGIQWTVNEARTSFSIRPTGAPLQLEIRPADTLMELSKTAQSWITNNNILPIGIMPKQRLVITDIPKEQHQKIRELIKANKETYWPIQEAFASLMPPGYVVSMTSSNGLTFDFRGDGTTVVWSNVGFELSFKRVANVIATGEERKAESKDQDSASAESQKSSNQGLSTGA